MGLTKRPRDLRDEIPGRAEAVGACRPALTLAYSPRATSLNTSLLSFLPSFSFSFSLFLPSLRLLSSCLLAPRRSPDFSLYLSPFRPLRSKEQTQARNVARLLPFLYQSLELLSALPRLSRSLFAFSAARLFQISPFFLK